MKKFFLWLISCVLVLIFASSFFTDYFVLPGDTNFLTALETLKYTCMIALSAGFLAWLLGSLAGISAGTLGIKCFSRFLSAAVSMLPAFFVSALVPALFGSSMPALAVAMMIPPFAVSFEAGVKTSSALGEKKMKCFIKYGYFKNYVLPMYSAPLGVSLFKSLRAALYLDFFLGILGLMPFETLGNAVFKNVETELLPMILGIGILILILINTACLLAGSDKGGFTRWKRL